MVGIHLQRLGRTCLVGWFTALTVLGDALAEPLPVDQFTRWPTIDNVVVSPSGKRLAMLVYGANGRVRLGVLDLDPIGKPRVLVSYTDADVTSVRWVSDERLVYEAFERDAVVRQGGAGTFAINQDGTDARRLIAWQTTFEIQTASRVLPYGWFLAGTIDDGSEDVFVYRKVTDVVGDVKEFQLARLNTATGALKQLSLGMPDGVQSWTFDESREPRMVTTYVKGRTKVYWRAAGADAWTEVADFDTNAGTGFSPFHIDKRGGVLVKARVKGDTEGLFKFDPIAKKLDLEPVLGVNGFDLNARAEIDSQGRLVGVHFTTDRPQSYWFDDGLDKLQRSVDAALPGRENRLYCGRCDSTRFFVVRSSSDRQPGEYFLLDRSKGSIAPIGASRPWINEATQGRRSLHRVSTRDGLSMPVYVTHPPGTTIDQKLPAVVLVHGGPWVRGSTLSWQAWPQFLASRGYRVLEPEFRGSEGYGAKHFRAGWKQWGLAMQDDLVDAVNWAGQQGLVDTKRVCVFGASYGGYAALMAPITHPGAFQCAASYAAVTDIDLMYSIIWSDFTTAWRQYGMPVLVGDRERDAQRIAAASPLKRAGEIKIPLLVGHGGQDRRVPIEHSLRFIREAKVAGVSVEQVEYTEEGHGFLNPENHANFLSRLERFLDTALKLRP